MKNSTAVVLILVSIGLFYTFTSDQYQKTKDLRTQAARYEDLLANIDSLTAARDTLLVKYQAMPADDVERLSKVLPPSIDTVRLALDFDSIAAKYGISIKNIQTESKGNDTSGTSGIITGSKAYETTTVSFEFVTSYENFKRFMHDIESSLRIIDVKSLSFDTGDANLSTYKISIETYSLK
ncbi:MAG: type 4a pilus biogenesis protein PilO [Patescibacteria group bacterium]